MHKEQNHVMDDVEETSRMQSIEMGDHNEYMYIFHPDGQIRVVRALL